MNDAFCMNKMLEFLKSQHEAEERGDHEFTCPLCGGKASWGRAQSNNHLHVRCGKCKFSIME